MTIARISCTIQTNNLRKEVFAKNTQLRALTFNNHMQKIVDNTLQAMTVFSYETLKRAVQFKKIVTVYTGKFTLIILRIQSVVLAIIIGADGSSRFFDITEYFHISHAAKKHGQGIPNIKNSCYLNSLVQVLRTTPSFRSSLDTIDQKIENAKTKQQRLCASLKRLFNMIESSDKQLTTKNIESIFKRTPVFSTHLKKRVQQDAQEYFTTFANTLEWKGFDIQEKDSLSSRFRCPVPKHTKALDRDAKVITLAIPNNNQKISIQEAINGKVKQHESLDEDDIKSMLNNDYFNGIDLNKIKNMYNSGYFKKSQDERIAIKIKEELYGFKNTQRTITRKKARKIFLNAQKKVHKEEDLKILLNAQEKINTAKQKGIKNPKVLPYTTTTKQMLHIKDVQASIGQTIPIALKRFDYNFNANQSTKKCNEVVPQKEIEIPLTTSKKNAKAVARLELQSIVAHHGNTANSGHYTAYERKDSSFIQYNDSRVIEHASMPDSVLKEGYIFFYTIKEIAHGK